MVVDFLRSPYEADFSLDEDGTRLIRGRFYKTLSRVIAEESNPFRSGVWLDPWDRNLGVGDQPGRISYDPGKPPIDQPIDAPKAVALVSRDCGVVPLAVTSVMRDGLPTGCFLGKTFPPFIDGIFDTVRLYNATLGLYYYAADASFLSVPYAGKGTYVADNAPVQPGYRHRIVWTLDRDWSSVRTIENIGDIVPTIVLRYNYHQSEEFVYEADLPICDDPDWVVEAYMNDSITVVVTNADPLPGIVQDTEV